MSNTNHDSLITTAEASETLGYTLQHTRHLLRSGVLDGVKLGRDWLIARESVAEYTIRRQPFGEEQSARDPRSKRSKPKSAESELPFPEHEAETSTEAIVNVASVPQRSPFRYPGGKTWLVPSARKWLGSLNPPIDELIEPFAGGAIIGLTSAFENLAKRVTLIEIDPGIGAVWATILNGRGEWLADQISHFDPTPTAVAKLMSQSPEALHALAFQTLVHNRVSRGGITAPGAGIVKNGENGRGLRSRWYPETLRRRLMDIVSIKDRIDFVCGDGLEAIREAADRANVAYFIDPPYTVVGRRLYRHSEIDHEALFATASTIRGHFLMTYDDAPEVRLLANRFGFRVGEVRMKSTHHTTKTELLISRNLEWMNGE
jgi:DNA adenine methylase